MTLPGKRAVGPNWQNGLWGCGLGDYILSVTPPSVSPCLATMRRVALHTPHCDVMPLIPSPEAMNLRDQGLTSETVNQKMNLCSI